MSNEKNNKICTVLCSLFSMLIILNVIAFGVYYFSHPEEKLWLQLWTYASSGVCKVISASLLLPIILFYLESKSKLADTAAKNLEDRRRAEEETRKRQEQRVKQERKAERKAVISKTAKLWGEIYNIAIDIRFYKTAGVNAPDIEELLKSIDRMIISGEDIVNDWYFAFPNISIEEQNIFVHLLNVIFNSSRTVAESIRFKTVTDNAIKDLQDSLGIILTSVKKIAHHRMLLILKLSSDLLENEANSDKATGRDEHIKDLTEWFNYIRQLAKQHNDVFFAIQGQTGNELRTVAKKFEQWVQENPTAAYDKFERYKEISAKFRGIPRDKRLTALNSSYSPDFVNILADELGLQMLPEEIKNPR